MERLVVDAPLGADLREKIAAASAGNPLFVEEMLAMVREHGGDGEISVPPTIQALLQARIDSLDGDVRVVMERGAVEGEVFHRGAVAELAPDGLRPEVGTHLATLVRKELIRSTSPTFPADEGFRFRHLLIRDAAYESLPKASRAELHERFADWLATQELVERDEIVGYHLEQAHRYRVELDSADPSLSALAERASAHLGAAGRAALGRGDIQACLTLTGRAASILPAEAERRHALAPQLAFAHWELGDFEAAATVLAAATAAADPVVAAIADVFAIAIDAVGKGSLSAEVREARMDAAYRVLENAGDDAGLAFYWWAVAGGHWLGLRATETIAACERGLEHLARTGERDRLYLELVWWIRSAIVLGPMPVPEGLQRLDALDETVEQSPLLNVSGAGARGRLLATQGNFEPARELARFARETMRAAGATVSAAGLSMYTAWIEQRAGSVEAWERALHEGLAELAGLDERAFTATISGYLAQCLYEQGRYEEAHALCAPVRETSPADDVVNFVYADAIEGAVLARQGRRDEGLRLLANALERVDATDFYFARAETRLLLADALALGGEPERARAVADEALEIFHAKGDVTGEARARKLLVDHGVEVA